MNKNLFGLGIVLVLAVLAGGAWKLILGPSSTLETKAKAIGEKAGKLDRYLDDARPRNKEDEGKILSTKRYAKKLQDSEKKMKAGFKEAEALFDNRCKEFQLFWELPKGEAPRFTETPPELADSGDFNAAYRDGNNDLREKYWEKFPAPVAEKAEDASAEEEDRKNKAPTIELVKSEEISANMPRAMKQYLITEAVFKVCDQLGIGGLQKIEFPQVRAKSTSRRSSKKKSEEEEGEETSGKAVYTKIEAEVDIHMQYSKLQDFLSVLYKSPRVPFVEPKSIEFGKIPSYLEGFATYIRQQTFKSQALAEAAQAAGEPSATEPPVRVIMRLVALDWKEVKMPKDDSGNKEEEQGK